MDTAPITPARLADSVLAVPPLCRDSSLRIHQEENRRLVEFSEAAGVNTFLYGGNAVLYHVRLSEYAQLLQCLSEIAGPQTLMIPSVGPAFGTMMDQLEVLADFEFPTVMVLPQTDVSDPAGRASGIRRFVDAYQKPIVLYLKHDRWLEPETVGKLYSAGNISWIKYAVVRDDPSDDEYLREVMAHVPGDVVVSGIGEQPAITHLNDFDMVSFTSGCVCVNPGKSMKMLRCIQASQLDEAEAIRQEFTCLEDLRNGINPIRVLHRAVELAEIAKTGPMLPMLGELNADETTRVAQACNELKD